MAAAVLGPIAVFVIGCASTVPATPRITPGIVSAPRQVNLIMKDYLYMPGIVDLVPGETIQLNVINGGLDTHEVVIGPQDVQAAWAEAERPAANPPPGPTPKVSVPPELEGVRVVAKSGETRTIIYTVPDDFSELLLLQCHISDHLERGMAGAVRFVAPGGDPLDAAGSGSGRSGAPAPSASPAP